MKKSLIAISLVSLTLLLLIILIFKSRFKSFVDDSFVRIGILEPNISGLKFKPISFKPIINNTTVRPVLFKSLTGERLDLSKLKGQVIFLNFWATWCAPCVAEMPSINSLYNKLKNNTSIRFFIVDIDRNLDKTEDFMKRKNYNLPIWVPVNTVPRELYNNTLPTTIIISKEGLIVFKSEEMVDYNSQEIENFLIDLAKKQN